MDKSLKRLDRLITTAIKPADTAGLHQGPATTNAWVYAIIEECENVQHYIRRHSGLAKDRDSFTLFIHNYQATLVYLLDLLYAHRFTQMDDGVAGLYDKVSGAIDKLLYHVKDRYKDFFNVHGKMPDKEQALARQNIEEGWPGLKQMLLHRNIEPELVEIVLEPVNFLLSAQDPGNISYYRLAHIKELTLAIDRWLNKTDGNLLWELLWELLYVNLNSPAFLAYCYRFITGLAERTPLLENRLKVLRDLYIKLHFPDVKRGIGYDESMPHCRATLVELVNTQISFVESDIRLSVQLLPVALPEKKRAGRKAVSGLTVQEIGVWIRGVIHVGIILSTKRNVMAIVAGRYQTLRQKNISAGSMDTKSSSIPVNSVLY